MNLKLQFSSLLIISLFIMSSCKENKQQGPPPPQKIPVIEVIEMDVPIFTEYVGQIYGQKDIPIRARVEGFLESIEFQEGSKVKKGQLLYTIDPQSLEAATNAQKSQVTAAQTALSKARADLDRIKPLAEANAISQSDLDAAQAAYDAAVADLNAAKSNLRSSNIDLSYTQVKSPLDGIIGKTMARVGEFVGREPNPVILNTVSKTDTIIVKFSLTESQYLHLSKRFIERKKEGELKQDYAPNVQLQLADGTTYDQLGHIDFIDRSIDQNTGTILVQASFPNPDGLLRPGLYSKVKVQTDLILDAIIVPQRCISELQGQFSVFIVNDSNKVESRPITIAYRAGDLAAISEGLEVGDKIVIDALQKVRSGMTIAPLDTVFVSKVFKKKQ
ncbi:MAG: efflux RND transporter periplasmic adaptor subunit [Bacteroidales bacterium]|nr:efflux RND transporter periplasmic adaptor subunit [Bacteroidales bacterium]